MRAIVVSKFGAEEALKYSEKEVRPKIKENQVLIQVHAAGVNPVDTYIRQGHFLSLPSLPYIPGYDGAGIVEEVGAHINQFVKGQRVYFCMLKNSTQNGSYAEYAAVDAENVFPLPASVTFSEGASIGIPYFTAYRALIIKCQAKSGDTVLVHGGSGGVGLAAVQIAKHLGMTVLATAGSPEGLKLVKKQGAAHVFNHHDKDYIQKIEEACSSKGIDVVIEMLSNVNLQKDLDLLAPRGRVAIVGCRGKVTIDPRSTMFPESSIIGVALSASTEEEWKKIAEAINEGLTKGVYRPIVNQTYPLNEASKAQHDIMHTKATKGNLVLAIS